MKRRLYYIYDRCADTFIYFCECPNDSVAIRQFNFACNKDFSSVAQDLELYCKGEFIDKDIVPCSEFVVKFASEKGVHIND